MGVVDLWPAFGTSANRTYAHAQNKVDLLGKTVGLELSGVLNPLVFAMGREGTFAKDISCHCRGDSLKNPDLIVRIAASAIAYIKDISNLCAAVVVVGEGNFTLKENEQCRRTHNRMISLEKGNYRQSMGVPDCVVKLVRVELQKEDRISFVLPPGEAEAQLCYMLRTNMLDTIIVGSNDVDITIYDIGSVGTAVICPQICGRDGNRTKGGHRGVQLNGNEVNLATLWGKVKQRKANACHDFSGMRMAGKAAFAGIIGHDYDTLPKSGQRPLGLKGVGTSKGLDAAKRGESSV